VEMSGPEHAAACDTELMNAVYTGALVERVKAWYPNVIGSAIPRSVRMSVDNDLSRRGTFNIFDSAGVSFTRARAPALAASDACLSACEVHITNAPPPPLVPSAPARKIAKKSNNAEITGIVVGVVGAVLVSLIGLVAFSVKRSKQKPLHEFEFASKHGSPCAYLPAPYCNNNNNNNNFNNALFADTTGRMGRPDAFCGYGVHAVFNPLSAPGVPVGTVPDSPVRCGASADALP